MDRGITAAPPPHRIRGLIFDFGGVVIKTPFELLRGLEGRLGLAPHTFDWHGPFAPDRDTLWERMQRNEISERDYWGLRAAEAGRAVGQTWTVRDLIGHLMADEREFVRPEAVAFFAEAAAASIPIIVLTNDLAAFHGAGWFESLSISNTFARVVDCSLTGILKPDPRSYAGAIAALGMPPQEALFVDDQPRNIAGGAQAGLHTELFDVTQPAATYVRIRRNLGSAA